MDVRRFDFDHETLSRGDTENLVGAGCDFDFHFRPRTIWFEVERVGRAVGVLGRDLRRELVRRYRIDGHVSPQVDPLSADHDIDCASDRESAGAGRGMKNRALYFDAD